MVPCWAEHPARFSSLLRCSGRTCPGRDSSCDWCWHDGAFKASSFLLSVFIWGKFNNLLSFEISMGRLYDRASVCGDGSESWKFSLCEFMRDRGSRLHPEIRNQHAVIQTQLIYFLHIYSLFIVQGVSSCCRSNVKGFVYDDDVHDWIYSLAGIHQIWEMLHF